MYAYVLLSMAEGIIDVTKKQQINIK